MRKNIKNYCVLLVFLLCGLAGARAQEKKDSIVNLAFRTVAKQDLLGAASTVDISDIMKKSYGTYSLDNLGSFVGGYTGNVWGQAPLVLVDGIPRRASDIRLTEIQSITVLKSGSAVVLYGSTAAKGVILITTKRGSVKPLQVDVRANTGVFLPKSYPKYLNAADYMTLYNEALTNDGIATSGGGYTSDQINNTRAGANPYKYPDINLLGSDYLKKAYVKSDVTTEVSGGNEFARYYTNIGMSYNNNLVKFGEWNNNNDFVFNIRGNVDMNLNKWLTASVDAVAVNTNNYTGRGDFWGATSSVTANFNKFSPYIPVSMLDPNNSSLQAIAKNSNHLIDGKYLLGGVSSSQTNVLSDMLAAGYIKTKSSTFLYNMSLGADLGSILKGLTFKAITSMDYSSIYSEAYQLPYATYQPTWSTVSGQDVITALTQYGVDRNSTNEFIGVSSYTQTISLRSQFGYQRTFANDHHVTATLLGWGYTSQFSSDQDNNGGSTYQPVKNLNLGFQAGYNYKSKYYVDFSGAVVHSVKLPPGKRNALSPTVSLGWRISDEDFFKNNISFINDLKLKTSYSSIKQDIDITGTRAGGAATDTYLYQGYYSNTATLGGWYQWRDGSAGGFTTLSGQADNPDLTYVKRNELTVGFDGSLFKNLITLDVNYFSQTTDGLLARGTSIYPSYFSGWGDFRPWINYNKEKRTGLDFTVNLNKQIGQVQYSLGVSGMYYNSKVLRRDELPEESYLARTGRALDANYGYISEGFFQSQADIANSPRQTFGTVKPGDLKYQDINNDGIIDSKDQVDLGHTGYAASPFSYGLNFTAKWKHFTLFALGSGTSGAVGFKNSSYYWVGGSSKYSDVVWGRWTEATKNTATYPRLTTNSSNNFRNSTFWMYKVNRFNLNRVQVTYDFDNKVFRKSFVHGLSVYAQGDNLLVISKERQLMETNIGSAPQTRFFNLGAKASF
ncbi:TonB-dependent receptor [Mucilaginibacter paludis DSM 18603]|uniref:TonB-dependent receptor n=2 Tax=Mucilaginibacter TaxID=423349 RepID=H1YGB6_9SPHI|nr:TonB-dependent receptor [Mucilaginibacter paludis DSM 18603]